MSTLSVPAALGATHGRPPPDAPVVRQQRPRPGVCADDISRYDDDRWDLAPFVHTPSRRHEHVVLMQSVIAGDAEVGVALNHDGVIAFINKKAPVALSSIQDPLYVDVHGIGILGNAQRPNAARLLVDFIVSKEGQTILAELDKTTVRDDVPIKYQFDRKNFRIVGPEARAKVEEYDKMMVDLFTK